MTKNSTKKIPRLRFKGFEGEWEEKRLEVVSKIGDGIHGTPKYNEKGLVTFINGNNLKNQKILFNKSNKHVDSSQKSLEDKSLNENTILISINGTIGNVAKYDNENVKLSKSTGYINLYNLNRNFVLYLLTLNKVQRYFINNLTGTTIKNLSLNVLRKMNINIPKLKEQQKIGSFFAKLDQLIDLQSKKVEQLKKLKRGYLQKMFPQKGGSVPRLRFDGFSGEWEEKKLKDISFSVSSSLTSKSTLKNGKYPLYDAGGVIGYINDFYSEHRYLSIIKDGSSAGKIKLMPKFTSVTGTMNYINSKDTNILFLYYLISTLNIKKFKLGTGIPHIYFKDYSKISLFVPSLGEQRKIGEFLYNLDKNVRIISSNIYWIKELKKAYLQKIFC